MSTPSVVEEAMRQANVASCRAREAAENVRRLKSKYGYEGDYERALAAEAESRALKLRCEAVRLFGDWLAGFD